MMMLVFMGQWAVEAEEEEDDERQRKNEKIDYRIGIKDCGNTHRSIQLLTLYSGQGMIDTHMPIRGTMIDRSRLHLYQSVNNNSTQVGHDQNLRISGAKH